MKLPAEISDFIYELVLSNGSVTIDMSLTTPRIKDPPISSHPLALTLTCKELWAQALPYFYKKNYFVFRMPGLGSMAAIKPVVDELDNIEAPWRHNFHTWLRTVGQKHVRKISAVEFDLGKWDLTLRRANTWRHVFDKLEKSTAATLATLEHLFQDMGSKCTVTVAACSEQDDISGAVEVSFLLAGSDEEAQEAVTNAFVKYLSNDDSELASDADLMGRISTAGAGRTNIAMECGDVLHRFIYTIWDEKGRTRDVFDWDGNFGGYAKR